MFLYFNSFYQTVKVVYTPSWHLVNVQVTSDSQNNVFRLQTTNILFFSICIIFLKMSRLIQTISELKIQLQSSLDERGKLNEELSRRDQQLITLKVELASIDERLKLTDEEVRRKHLQPYFPLEQIWETIFNSFIKNVRYFLRTKFSLIL